MEDSSRAKHVARAAEGTTRGNPRIGTRGAAGAKSARGLVMLEVMRAERRRAVAGRPRAAPRGAAVGGGKGAHKLALVMRWGQFSNLGDGV